MAFFAVEAPIKAPPARVWDYLSDPGLMATWLPGAERLEVVGGGPVGRGAELVLHQQGEKQSSQVVEFEEGRLIAVRMVRGSLTVIYHYGVRPDGDDAIATLDVACSVQGVARLFSPLIKTMLRNADRGQLPRLKARVEENASSML